MTETTNRGHDTHGNPVRSLGWSDDWHHAPDILVAIRLVYQFIVGSVRFLWRLLYPRAAS